jgi:LAS superfamily LD-carboxypeptidase LdcB
MDSEIVPTFGLDKHSVSFDFDSDDSFQKYLHTDHPFHDISYVPTDLVPIHSNFTANASRSFKLREEAAIQFADMAWHFRNAFSGDKLYISSAYRSRGLQDYLIKQ